MTLSEQLINSIIELSVNAGKAILDVYQQESSGFEVQIKSDNSPLTKADLAANKIITQGLASLTPDIPVISEESAHIPYETRSDWQTYWLVDPLDGTKEFIRRNDDFSVNIALIENGVAILGVVCVPVFNQTYWAAQGMGAYVRDAEGDDLRISVTPCETTLRVAASRSHPSPKLKEFLANLDRYELTSRGSALKICLVAQGLVDIYPRFGPTSEWDTGAAHCVLKEAGGDILEMSSLQPLVYNSKPSLVNPEFIAIGDTQFAWETLL